MKCLPLNRNVDICVSIDVKLIYKQPGNDRLEDELQRLDDQSRAKHLGAGFETHIAQSIAGELSRED